MMPGSNADGGIDGLERPGGHAGCLDDIFAAMAEGRPAETCAADNVKSMAMVFGAMESSRRQATVRMAPLLQEYASYREL